MDAITYIHLRSGDPLPTLPLPPFKAVLVAEEVVDDEWRSKVAGWLVRGGCLYFVAWGEACERWHDHADDANIAEFEGRDIPDERFVMTTSHEGEPMLEALWFVAANAHHPTVELTNTVIVHVARHARAEDLLKLYQSAANE